MLARSVIAAPTLSPWASTAADLTFNSNVTNAPFAADVRSDTSANASLTGGASILLDRDLALDLAGSASTSLFDRFNGLTHAAVQASASLRRKFGLGAFAPYASARAAVERREYRDDDRTGWSYEASLAAGQRFSDALRADIEYRYQRYLSDHNRPVVPFISGTAFDTTNNSVRVEAEYAPFEPWSMVAGFTWRGGDVVASTRRNTTIFFASAALVADPAFGPDFFAYRLGGRSQLFDVTASYALGAHTSVALTYERWITHADADLNYFNSVVRASLARDF